MPVFNRELAGNKGRPTIVSVFKEFEQVSAIFITEHRQSPIVSNVPLAPPQIPAHARGGIGKKQELCHIYTYNKFKKIECIVNSEAVSAPCQRVFSVALWRHPSGRRRSFGMYFNALEVLSIRDKASCPHSG